MSMRSDEQVSNPGRRRKSMQGFQDLSRAPLASFWRKQRQQAEAGESGSGGYRWIQQYLPSQAVAWIWEYLSHRLGRRHPFQTYPVSGPDRGIHDIDGVGEVRIALAGDWGTGTEEAATIARRIAEFDPHYTIHLGDVYYVGDHKEVAENFLGISDPNSGYEACLWPNGSAGSFALNGNHEMYARGFAYFRSILPALGLISNGRPGGQKASFFCLQNEHWRIIALDTGYNSVGWPLFEYVVAPDCRLPPELMDWLREIVRLQEDDKRGLIILSHHQYYSAFDDNVARPAVQLREFISRPVLWFWGHEHRWAVYDEYALPGGIRAFGRCIGHAGMPVELPPSVSKHPECPVQHVDSRVYENGEKLKIGYNGFARIRLRGDEFQAEYVDLEGRILFAETWRTVGGNLVSGAS